MGWMRWGYVICERRAHMVLQAGLRAHASFSAGLENIYTFVIVFASVYGLRERERGSSRGLRTVRRHLAVCSCALCCLFRPALGTPVDHEWLSVVGWEVFPAVYH